MRVKTMIIDNRPAIALSVTEKETVNIPLWAGLAVMAMGGVLLFAGRER